MRSKKMNQKMTLLTLVVALGVAVYLNWEYAKSTDLALDAAEANAPVSTGVVTDALAVDGEVETGDKNYGEAQLVSVGEPTGEEFFEQARLTRTKTRDEALDTLHRPAHRHHRSYHRRKRHREPREGQRLCGLRGLHRQGRGGRNGDDHQ